MGSGDAGAAEVAGVEAPTEAAILSAYISDARNVELPEDLTPWMKLLLLDSLGCGLLGSRLEWTERVRDNALAHEGEGRATVWGTGSRLSASNAAMVNAVAVQGFELDDVGHGCHFGSVTVPVALALADAGSQMTGTALLRSVAAGIDVGARFSSAMGSVPHVTCGFHGPSLYGAFAAVATASYSLGLNQERCAHALGNVAQFCGGLMATHHGGMGKRLLNGRAAHSGTVAAQLAHSGFTNSEHLFSGDYGSFPQAFSGGRDTYDLEQLVKGLGEDFRGYGIRFKFLAARGPMHPALDAYQALKAEHQLDPSQISEISVGLPEASFKAVGFPYEPTSPTSAQMNLRFCLATLILEEDLFVDHFDESRLRDPALLDMIARIEVHHDEALDKGSSYFKSRDTSLEILLSDGRQLHRRENRYLLSFGEDANASERIAAKFRRSTATVLSASAQSEVIHLCQNIEAVEDVTQLTRVLSGSVS